MELINKLYSLNVQLWIDEGRLCYKIPKHLEFMEFELSEEMKKYEGELLVFLKDNSVVNASLRTILPISKTTIVDRSKPIALSFAQQRLWFLYQLEGAGSIYNIPGAFMLEGVCGQKVMEKCFQVLVERHESLRTFFPVENGTPIVKISNKPFCLNIIDLTAFDSEEQQQKVKALVEDDAVEPFVFQTGPLFRASLVLLGHESNVLLLNMHHIISDSWSKSILIKEWLALYEGYCNGKEVNLPHLPIQYVDFALWQRNWLTGEVLEKQVDYWKQKLDGAPHLLELPTDKLRPSIQNFEGACVNFTLSPELKKGLELVSRGANCTLFTTILSTFAVLLSRYSGQSDIVIGTPIANRTHNQIESLIGFFENTLVLRLNLINNPLFKDLLKQARKTFFEAYTHKDIPFEHLLDDLKPERNLGYSPMFQVMFILQKAARFEGLPHVGLNIKPLDVGIDRPHLDLTLVFIEEENGGLSGVLEYDRELFNADTVSGMARHLVNLMEGVVPSPEKAIQDLPLLDSDEIKKLVFGWNNTKRDYPFDGGIVRLFETQVALTPDAVAVVCERKNISYDILNRRANQLASILREKGVGPDDIVGLIINRSVEMLVSILAVLKAGGAYMPIATDYPQNRVLSMLQSSGAKIVLTDENSLKGFTFTVIKNLETLHCVNVGSNDNSVYHNRSKKQVYVTASRPAIQELDKLPFPDRSLVSYKKYHPFLGIAPAKHTVSILTSRGCPFRCLYCHDLWPKKQKFRSAEDLFEEISYCYNAGVRRFTVIDDIFNLNKENSGRLLKKIIRGKLDIQLFFPNGLRGDVLTKEFIDLMVEAGTVNIDVALESACPRIQKLVHKNLDLDKFGENIRYIAQQYPHLILEMEMMIGFPSETEEEALQTFDFLKTINWVHFPNLNILKIFPNTKMEALALENGVSKASIEESANRSYHELPDTLPFSKQFVLQFQAKFVNEYFLYKKRLLDVLPQQMKILTEDELVQKYNSYLPAEIKCFDDILQVAGLELDELESGVLLQEDLMSAPDFDEKIKINFPAQIAKKEDALRVLLLDLSLLFSCDAEGMLYDMIEAPLGLVYLLSFVNEKFGEQVDGKIAKSRIDFNSFSDLKELIVDFKPQIIGIRTLSLHKNFFHKTVTVIKQWLSDAVIITGGPYATSEYNTILSDQNVDVVVKGEGEFTFSELIGKVIENSGKLPGDVVLVNIPGIAFIPRFATIREDMDFSRDILILDNMEELLDSKPSENIEASYNAENLAYLLYTSGSTGTPKGVAMGHGALSNLVNWHLNHQMLSKESRTLQFAHYSFDVSFQEMFSTWCSGGTLIMIAEELRRDTVALIRFLNENSVNRLFLPFVALQQLAEVMDEIEEVPNGLADVITAGEQLRITPAIKKMFKNMNGCSLHNHYGPSESHVVTSFILNGPVDEWPKLPSIGRPISNTQIYILDSNLQPTPVGISGELHISGLGLACGYLNNADLTKSKFINNPFSVDSGEIMYKTGDFARYLPDGNVEFLGRIDEQVKIRGFRIEPGEVEATLSQHASILENAVVVNDELKNVKRLVAYFTTCQGVVIENTELREFLAKRLPDYMVPSAFVQMEELPLSRNNKIDRLALKNLEVTIDKLPTDDNLLPGTPEEVLIAGIWREVLNIGKVGVTDDFFELGGHSLLATQVMSRLRKNFDMEISLQQLFECPTIASLGKLVTVSCLDSSSSEIT